MARMNRQRHLELVEYRIALCDHSAGVEELLSRDCKFCAGQVAIMLAMALWTPEQYWSAVAGERDIRV